MKRPPPGVRGAGHAPPSSPQTIGRKAEALAGRLPPDPALAAVGRGLVAIVLFLGGGQVGHGDDAPAASPRATDPPASGQQASDANGQDDLDAAVDAKFAVKSLDDFDAVLALCRRALGKGLDAESRRFAEELYTGTLVDRAAMLVEAICDAPAPNPHWPRMRQLAMRDLDEIVRRDAGLGQAHLMIARLESLPRGDRERAAAAARRAIELLGDDRLQMARARLVLATLASERDEREREYDQAVDLAPRDAAIRRARGMHRLMVEDFAAAREDLAVAVSEDGDDAGLHEALGVACMMDEKFDDALRAFDRALELAPDSAGALMQRARLHAAAGDLPKALVDLERALEIDPGDTGAHLLRARIKHQTGDDDAALADVAAVLADDPDNEAALELRGLIAAGRADYPTAIRDFRRLVSRHANDPTLLGQLGMLYLAAKQPREAIRRFTRALEVDADHFPSRRGRSDAEISIGDHRAAIVDLERAHTQRPDDTGVLNNLAWLLATSPDDDVRDGKRAVELALKACEGTEWKEPHIISTLAAGFAETGDFASARKYSRQAVEQGTATPEIRQQLESELASYGEERPWRERQEIRSEDAVQPGDRSPVARPRRPFDEE